MYLAFMLIIVSALVFYNEYNTKLNIAELLILFISFIAIVRASFNYITLLNTTQENFSNNNTTKHNVKTNKKHRNKKHSNKKEDKEDILTLSSDKVENTTKNYFDTNINNTSDTDNFNNAGNLNNYKDNINKDAVNQINSILGISPFEDIPNTTHANTQQPKLDNIESLESLFNPQILMGAGANDATTSWDTSITNANANANSNSNFNTQQQKLDNIESTFNPQIIIGSGDKNANAPWNTSFTHDNMTFNNTMYPSENLWGSNTQYNNTGINNNTGNNNNNNHNNTQEDNKTWTQNLNDYNNGKWNPHLYKNPSDYTDYNTPPAYGMNTSSSATQETQAIQAIQATQDNQLINKKCGEYNDLSTDKTGNLVVSNYKDAKKWYPGYTYVPPVFWDVPQKHNGGCMPNNEQKKYTKLTGLVDRGLPINVLELNQDGKIADTEETVSMSNVGSMIPSFKYQEQPFSKPYV